MRRLLPLILCPWLGLLGCGGEDPPDPCLDAPTYTNQISALLRDHCLACHADSLQGPARNGAPAERTFDDWDLLQPHIADVADVITSGRMPPMDNPFVDPVSPAQRQLVAEWRRCGYPR